MGACQDTSFGRRKAYTLAIHRRRRNFRKSAQIADVLEPYAEFRKQFLPHLANVERGDPDATAEAVLKLVDADNPPQRLGLGTSILQRARAAYAERLATGNVGGRLRCSDGRTEKSHRTSN